MFPIFEPISFMTRTETIRYNDLSNYLFSGEEKNDLCIEMMKTNHLLRGNSNKMSISVVSSRYNLPSSTISDWITQYRNGRLLRCSIGGAPDSLDTISIQNIKNQLTHAENKVIPLSRGSTEKLFIQEMDKTRKRRFQDAEFAPFQDISTSSIDYRTIKKIKTNNGIKNRVAQDLSDARYKALTDIRLGLKAAVLIHTFGGDLSAENKWNEDASTFICSQQTSGKYVCVVREKGAVSLY